MGNHVDTMRGWSLFDVWVYLRNMESPDILYLGEMVKCVNHVFYKANTTTPVTNGLYIY